jgi:hypothetical protein
MQQQATTHTSASDTAVCACQLACQWQLVLGHVSRCHRWNTRKCHVWQYWEVALLHCLLSPPDSHSTIAGADLAVNVPVTAAAAAATRVCTQQFECSLHCCSNPCLQLPVLDGV